MLKVGVAQNKTTWQGSMAIATPILVNPTVSNCEGWPHKQRMKDVTKKLVELNLMICSFQSSHVGCSVFFWKIPFCVHEFVVKAS